MAKTLEDAKTVLEAADDGEELYQLVIDAIAAKGKEQKDKGIKRAKKANEEAAGLKKQLKVAQLFQGGVIDLGFELDEDEDDPDVVTESVGTFFEGISTRLKAKNGTADPEEVAGLQRTNKKLEKDLVKANEAKETAETTATEMIEKAKRGVMRGTLLTALLDDKGETRVYGPDLLVDSLMAGNRVKLLDDNKTVVFVGADEDDEIDLADGITKLLEDRKDIVKNSQKGGTGERGGPGQGPDRKPGDKSDADRTKELRSRRGGSGVANL